MRFPSASRRIESGFAVEELSRLLVSVGFDLAQLIHH
jgi:hypothetical protein